MTNKTPLPRDLSQPAKRALAQKEIDSLEIVAHYTEKELLALHGVGPKTIRQLKEEMEKQQLSFKTN
ncbi:helix-hairpin-helix domain-containing protein [Jeotgalibacillus aurantiacus]|uniref:helix-hairpin-helix domain-containing protein n=1 Tax=Jeotgalibacillus aurantiacus TaxID=2763266 RepID=UPI001D0A2957|nr:helix-hairpin-helix domain-containing protein [Jeotgalibacillus aurantiacus]